MKKCQICQKKLLITEIDGLILCYPHSREYIHQKEYPETSIHKKTFESRTDVFCCSNWSDSVSCVFRRT